MTRTISTAFLAPRSPRRIQTIVTGTVQLSTSDLPTQLTPGQTTRDGLCSVLALPKPRIPIKIEVRFPFFMQPF